jgi:hypothetical protein
MNRILKQIKKLLYCLFLLAVIAIATYNVNLNKKSTDMAKLTLANITTLANAESSSGESGTYIASEGTCENYQGRSCTIYTLLIQVKEITIKHLLTFGILISFNLRTK